MSNVHVLIVLTELDFLLLNKSAGSTGFLFQWFVYMFICLITFRVWKSERVAYVAAAGFLSHYQNGP